LIFQITFENNIQVKDQNNIQPIAIVINDIDHSKNSHEFIVVHSKITQSITKNKARDVPSLNKLSHSNISANLLGAQILLNIDNTATGSVADISAQNNKQTINGISNQKSGNNKNKPPQIKIDEIISHTTAKEVIIFQFFNISL